MQFNHLFFKQINKEKNSFIAKSIPEIFNQQHLNRNCP